MFYKTLCLLINFANSLNPDQARGFVRSDPDPNCLTLVVFLREFFERKKTRKACRQRGTMTLKLGKTDCKMGTIGLSRTNFPFSIDWTSLFQILGVLVGIFIVQNSHITFCNTPIPQMATNRPNRHELIFIHSGGIREVSFFFLQS